LQQYRASRIELYLALEDIDQSWTKTKSPQPNGIAERFHNTVLDKFYRIAFRKKLYLSIEALQANLDEWIRAVSERSESRGDGGFPNR
jgi:transposase InsO family protein